MRQEENAEKVDSSMESSMWPGVVQVLIRRSVKGWISDSREGNAPLLDQTRKVVWSSD